MLTWEVCEAIALIFGSALGLLCSYIIFAVQKIINRGSWTKMTSSTWSPDTIAALALSSWVAKFSLCYVSWKMFKYGLCVFNKALWSPRSDVETTIFKVSSGSEIGLLGQQLGHKGLKLQRKIRDSETDEKNDWKLNAMCFVSATLNTEAGSMLARSSLTRRHAMEGSYGQWPPSEMQMLQDIEDNKTIQYINRNQHLVQNYGWKEMRYPSSCIWAWMSQLKQIKARLKTDRTKWFQLHANAESKKNHSSFWKLCCVTKKMWEWAKSLEEQNVQRMDANFKAAERSAAQQAPDLSTADYHPVLVICQFNWEIYVFFNSLFRRRVIGHWESLDSLGILILHGFTLCFQT